VFPNCPTNQIGEVGFNIKGTGVLPAGEPSFDIHPDDAPTFYVNNQPARTDSTVRKLERDVAAITTPDPYQRSGGVPQTVPLAQAMADPVEENALHMVNSDPARTPTFTMFGNPDFFVQTSNPCTGVVSCVTPGFAWNHGDIQGEIANTWVGISGPGVARRGIDSTTWTDHTNVRPTVLAMAGLHDDYADDGRVLVEGMEPGVTVHALKGSNVKPLMDAYEQVNASFGQFAAATLAASTRAIKSTDDSEYNSIENSIADLTTQRDALVSQIRSALNAAAFSNTPIDPSTAAGWISTANSLIAQAQALRH